MFEKKKRLFSNKKEKINDSTSNTAQQITQIAQQVTQLKEQLKDSQADKASLTDDLEKLRMANKVLQESQKKEKVDSSLLETLENEKADLQTEIDEIKEKLKNEKTAQQNIITELNQKNEASVEKALALNKENLKIKAQVADVLLELQEEYHYKNTVIDSERELIEQEKASVKSLKDNYHTELQTIKAQAQNEADSLLENAKITATQLLEEARAQSEIEINQRKEKIVQLEARIDYYSAKISEYSEVIDGLLKI